MKKIVKILLITLTGVIVIISALSLGGYLYVKSFLFDFDKASTEDEILFI